MNRKFRRTALLVLLPALFAFSIRANADDEPKSRWRRTLDYLIAHDFSFNIGCSFKSGMFMLSPSLNIRPVGNPHSPDQNPETKPTS